MTSTTTIETKNTGPFTPDDLRRMGKTVEVVEELYGGAIRMTLVVPENACFDRHKPQFSCDIVEPLGYGVVNFAVVIVNLTGRSMHPFVLTLEIVRNAFRNTRLPIGGRVIFSGTAGRGSTPLIRFQMAFPDPSANPTLPRFRVYQHLEGDFAEDHWHRADGKDVWRTIAFSCMLIYGNDEELKHKSPAPKPVAEESKEAKPAAEEPKEAKPIRKPVKVVRSYETRSKSKC